MTKRFILVFSTLFIVFLLSACSSAQPSQPAVATNPLPAATSEPTVPSSNVPLTTPAAQISNSASPEVTGEAQSLAYPAPTEYVDVNPAYPSPATAEPLVMGPLPTADPKLGILTGTLLVKGQPAVERMLYLAEIIKDDQGNEKIISYDKQNSPKTYTDQNGQFTFMNIKPAKYGLVLDIVIDSYVLNYPDKNEQILATVEAGKPTDIGKIDYDELPGG